MIMWMMFKKEWRENVPYFAAAFVIVLLVLDYTAIADFRWKFLGIFSFIDGSDWFQNIIGGIDTLPMLEDSWKILCMIAAVLLGLRQIYTEHLRRTWPLLVQLPIQREKILYAKLLAGLTLLVALFLPAGLLIVSRLSAPGVWPGPVYVMCFLPLLLHLLGALACYPIIVLTALAPLRWFGTRLLVPFAAVPVLLLVYQLIDRFRVYYGTRNGNDAMIWSMAGITLFVAVTDLWALRSVARTREY
jgi:hypothetical protein